MHRASNEYKKLMSKPLRRKSYISVGVGIVNQEAQADARIDSELMPYSTTAGLFADKKVGGTYATLEQDFFSLDGKMLFIPDYDQYVYNGLTTKNILQSVKIKLGQIYALKGIMLEFGPNYPTEFNIIAAGETLHFFNNSSSFITTDLLGEADEVIIEPLQMVGGAQRMRITKIVMGAGLTYTNDDITSMTIKETNSSIAAELPTTNINITILDYADNYNVDKESSFINFLETGQKITVSIGQKLDSGIIEWIPTATGHLSNWSSTKGKMSFTAKDIFSFMDDEYSAGNMIYERTAYDEAIKIVKDMGLKPDQYFIDDCMRNVLLTNPMPKAKHKECLQLLCNACRCIMLEDEEGMITLKANFAVVLDPEDIIATAENAAAWSNTHNILVGAKTLYADLSKDYMALDGSMVFLPESGPYDSETGFITDGVANASGEFDEPAKLRLELGAAYTYYGIYIEFADMAAEQVNCYLYNSGELEDYVEFTDLEQINYITYMFAEFDTIEVEIAKAKPGSRVHINKISFGTLTDYELKTNQMLDTPIGIADKKVKDIFVKIYSFEENENGEPVEVKDDVYVQKNLNPTGEVIICKNPLVGDAEHAEKLIDWLGNYYSNNISYSVDFRGEPRLHAADLLRLDTNAISDLQTEIEETTLKFNGALKGTLDVRRAVNMVVLH